MIKTIFIALVLIVCLTSCSEEFKTIDPTEFNNLIVGRLDINTAEQLIQIYYNYPKTEGTPKLTFEKQGLGDNKIEVTLIHDRQKDDSQRATKIIMTAEKNGATWTVLEIRKNWKCYDGRGHTNWGTEYCY